MCDTPATYNPTEIRNRLLLLIERTLVDRRTEVYRKWVLPELDLTRKRQIAEEYLLLDEDLAALMWLYRHGPRIDHCGVRVLHTSAVLWWDELMGEVIWPLSKGQLKSLKAVVRAWKIQKLKGKQ